MRQLAGYDDVDFFGLGAEPSPVTWQVPSWWWFLHVASIGASAYHGYKRSGGDVGATVGWGILGAVFPLIVPAYALTQGFGKRG